MEGGGGDDEMRVDNGDDSIVELAGGGNDIVYASTHYNLNAGAHVEILSTISLGSTIQIHLRGNELAQQVLGNNSANVIRSGGGADALVGYGGDDEYFIEDGREMIFEAAGGGRDVVYASISYALTPGTAQVEVLSAGSLGATDSLQLTGNEFVQEIVGNAGDNVLRGGGGADNLVGNGGDDQYLIEDGRETIVEAAGGGRDVVYASVDYVLGGGIEVEVLSTVSLGDTDAIDLTGNDGANTLLGNAGNNVLNGGLAADTLAGFGGADTFAFTTALGGGNVDFLYDMAGGVDKIALDNAVFTGLADGALSAAAFRLGGGAADADDRIIYDQNSGALYFDVDGLGGTAAVQFGLVQAGTNLQVSDFQVI